MEATQQEKPAGKQGRGRRKIPIQRIHDDSDRMVTFSKRKKGIFKKAGEIGTLCGAEVGVLMFSQAGKPYAYGVPNVETISKRLLWRVNPEAQGDDLSRIVKDAEGKMNVRKLNNKFDELSVYLKNLQEEGGKLQKLKKQTFDGGCWWDIPVEDLNADRMQRLKVTMEDIKKKTSTRLRELRAGNSSSSAVVQPVDIQMGIKEGDGGFGNFMKGGLPSAVAGVQGGVRKMGGNLGQGYGDSGGFCDWRAGSSTAARILGGIGELDDWDLLMGGNGVTGNSGGVGGGFGNFPVGGSTTGVVQQGGMQVAEYGGCGDVADGGIGQWWPVEYGGGGYGWGVASGGGLSDGWNLVNSPSTFTDIHCVNPIQMAGNGNFCVCGASACGGGGSGPGDWGEVGVLSMQMGGNGEFCYNDGVYGSNALGEVGGGGSGAGAGGRLGGWGVGGAPSSSSLQPNLMQMGGNGGLDYGGFGGAAVGEFGGGDGFGDFTAGDSFSDLLDLIEIDRTRDGGSFHGGGGGFETNNGFDCFLYDGVR